MKIFAFPVLAVLVAFLAGCAGPASTTSPAAGPPANVAGSWYGSTIGGAGSTSVSLTLTQAGSAVTGQIEVGGRPDMSGPLTGSVSGDYVRFSLTDGFGRTSELHVVQNSITGMVGDQHVSLRRN